MKYLLYPILRIFRKTVFHLTGSSVIEYNDEELAQKIVNGDLQLWKSQETTDCILSHQTLFSNFVVHRATPLQILDFGGGGGRHGFQHCRNGEVLWTVVETPALVEAANQTLSETGIRFTSSIPDSVDKTSKFDIVHVSSSLQYTSNPSEILRELLALEATYLVFERLVLTSRSYFVQFNQYSLLADNIPFPKREQVGCFNAVRYPLIAIPEMDFFGALKRNYEILEKSVDVAQSHLPSFKGLAQYTVIAKRKDC